MVLPEQLCGRLKAQPVQTETGGKKTQKDYLQISSGAEFIIQT